MHFWSGEKYALSVRRKICTFGLAKNMHFWSGEKYALLVRRKICTFGPAKNMPITYRRLERIAKLDSLCSVLYTIPKLSSYFVG
jgi:hypothetical protein